LELARRKVSKRQSTNLEITYKNYLLAIKKHFEKTTKNMISSESKRLTNRLSPYSNSNQESNSVPSLKSGQEIKETFDAAMNQAVPQATSQVTPQAVYGGSNPINSEKPKPISRSFSQFSETKIAHDEILEEFKKQKIVLLPWKTRSEDIRKKFKNFITRSFSEAIYFKANKIYEDKRYANMILQNSKTFKLNRESAINNICDALGAKCDLKIEELFSKKTNSLEFKIFINGIHKLREMFKQDNLVYPDKLDVFNFGDSDSERKLEVGYEKFLEDMHNYVEGFEIKNEEYSIHHDRIETPITNGTPKDAGYSPKSTSSVNVKAIGDEVDDLSAELSDVLNSDTELNDPASDTSTMEFLPPQPAVQTTDGADIKSVSLSYSLNQDPATGTYELVKDHNTKVRLTSSDPRHEQIIQELNGGNNLSAESLKVINKLLLNQKKNYESN